MSDIAIAEPSNGRAAPPSSRRERIPARIRQAIELLATGECKTQKAAAARVGMNEQHLCRMLQRPQLRAFLADRARQTIATASLRAANRVAELIDASSEHVSLDASKWTLAVEGIKPADEPTIVNNINVMSGYVIDLASSPPRDRGRGE